MPGKAEIIESEWFGMDTSHCPRLPQDFGHIQGWGSNNFPLIKEFLHNI